VAAEHVEGARGDDRAIGHRLPAVLERPRDGADHGGRTRQSRRARWRATPRRECEGAAQNARRHGPWAAASGPARSPAGTRRAPRRAPRRGDPAPAVPVRESTFGSTPKSVSSLTPDGPLPARDPPDRARPSRWSRRRGNTTITVGGPPKPVVGLGPAPTNSAARRPPARADDPNVLALLEGDRLGGVSWGEILTAGPPAASPPRADYGPARGSVWRTAGR